MLMKSIERLEDTIDAETAALMAHKLVDQQEINRRKSQSLLELSRLSRTLRNSSPSPELLSRMERLREKLAHNHAVLEMHLRAIQEVSNIVSNAIQRAESDGTYSVGIIQSEAR